MSEDKFNEGNSLFIDEDYEEALKCYNEAIELDNGNSNYFIKRSACYLKLKKNRKSLADANAAIKIDPENKQAHFRVGLAKFELEEYESAKDSFEKAYILQENNLYKRWSRKCEAEIENEDREEEDEEENIEFEEYDPEKDSEVEAPKEEKEEEESIEKKEEPKEKKMPIPDEGIEYDYIPLKIKEKIKYTWYQNKDYVTINVFAQNVKKEDLDIHFTNEELTVNIKLESGTDYVLILDLCDKIVPKESKFLLSKPKIEIKLKKERPLKWASLEKIDSPFAVQEFADTSKVNKNEYPTSNKKKIDWDAIKIEETPESKQSLNEVFQGIFSRGSSDQQRAMMKSFWESGGTVLSTNWDDIGSRKVECTAPKGMEVHTWDEVHK
eukprot:TRINITY_DN1993_c0_g3_i1.p1 TRINITY_DN1993_c0_g3~~TRINITY_DN1993_c0_g3_i1.p1  ORF type:complete len:382 (+),score=162.02 TRINITY_DN1993_c0_g3_i1:35-1180(+)